MRALSPVRAVTLGAGLCAGGGLGLLIGLVCFPDSNLLGGFGPVFGILVMAGGAVLAVAGLAALSRWLSGRG